MFPNHGSSRNNPTTPQKSAPLKPSVSAQTTSPIRPPVSNSGTQPEVIHAINSLNPYNRRWTIKGRVTQKSEMKTWNNAKSSGKLFSVDLLDASGGEIRCTMFNEAADQFWDVFELNKIYLVSKGTLKPANKKYATLKNAHEIQLDSTSSVVPVSDEGEIPSVHMNPVDIANLRDMKDEIVDIVAVVAEVGPLIMTKTRQGRELERRVLILADASMCKIELTLWSEKALNLGFDETSNPVLMCKSLKLSDFAGCSLSSSFGSQIFVNPPNQTVDNLTHWWANLSPDDMLRFQNLSDRSNQPISNTSSVSEPIMLGHLKEMIVANSSLTQRMFSGRGWITSIKHESDNPDKPAMWYKGCPTCSKKVEEDTSGQYTCTKCQQTLPTYTHCYMVHFSASDPSGSLWLTAFREEAQNLLVFSAKDLNNLAVEKPQEFNQAISDRLYRLFDIKIKCQYSVYNDAPVVRATATKLHEVDFVQGTQDLIQKIKLLQMKQENV